MPENATTGAIGTPAEPVAAPATPPAGSSGTTAASANGTPAEPTSASPSGDYISLDEAKKLRSESSGLRKRLAELEAAQQAAEDAKLSATDKLTKQLAQLQQQHAEYQTASQQRILRALTRAEAADMGLNPALAARLIDLSEVEFDDDGDPQNLRTLLEKAAKEYGLTPGTAAQPAQPGAPVPNAGGPSNPSRSGTNGGAKVPLSQEYIDNLITTNPQEYVARHDEIRTWLLAHPQRGRR